MLTTHHHRHAHCLTWRVETDAGAIELVVPASGAPAILVTGPDAGHLALDLTGYQLAALLVACREAASVTADPRPGELEEADARVRAESPPHERRRHAA